jgi:hypothetical protein
MRVVSHDCRCPGRVARTESGVRHDLGDFGALALGFTLSAIVQAVVSKREMTRLLPDDSPRALAVACGLGAASSSRSYAAVALCPLDFSQWRQLRRGDGVRVGEHQCGGGVRNRVMAILIGWQFTVAEFVGMPITVAFMALLFRGS